MLEAVSEADSENFCTACFSGNYPTLVDLTLKRKCMNYKTGLILILFVLFNSLLFPQSTYFIKYKDYVSKQEIESKIQTQQYLPAGKLSVSRTFLQILTTSLRE